MDGLLRITGHMSVLSALSASTVFTALSASTAFTALTALSALSAQTPTTVSEAESVIRPLVESYGVSGTEAPVRETVKRLLPSWAKTETDTAGNLWVRVGKGDPIVVIVAHLDEIGFRVTRIREDGTLELEQRGGFFPSLFEGRPALVHTEQGPVPGVFMPRDSVKAGERRTPPSLRADVGVSSSEAVEQLGIRVGNTLTMVKQYVRMAGSRAIGRSFDDRMGCAALILALKHLDRARLKHQVIFVWSVREEIGLEGATAVANQLGLSTARVHAVDTFVTADSPLEVQTFAVAPVGKGAVARALDNSSITPPALVDSLVALAKRRAIALQVGTTNGGNDGSVFAPYGVPDVPIGWPLRYSHSPAEVVDLKDLVSLGDLTRAIAEDW